MKRQIRLYLTVSEEEDRAISEGYAHYLLSSEEQLTRNQWLRKIIMTEARK